MVHLISRGGLSRIISGKAGSCTRACRAFDERDRKTILKIAISLFSPEGTPIYDDDDPQTMDINGLLRRRLTRPSLDRGL